MNIRHTLFVAFFILLAANAASAHDTLQFTVTNLPCTDHFSYLNNEDSSKGSYDTLFSRGDFLIVFDSVGHFIDTTFYTIKDIPQAQLHIVHSKIAGFLPYIHFTSGAIIGMKSVTFELHNVMADISLPPTYFQLHGDTLNGHNLSFAANYRFITGGGYSENDYTSTGLYRDSSLFTFSLTPEMTAGVTSPEILSTPLIFPNPASSILHVQLPENNAESIFIYDVTGKKVLSGNGNGKLNDLNISSLSNGIYIVRIGSFSKELVIQR